MKLISISESTKKNIKEYLKSNKDSFVFALALVIVLNICSGYTFKNSDRVMSEVEQLLEDIKNEEGDKKEESVVTEQNKEEKITKRDIISTIVNMDDKTLEMLAKRLNRHFKIANSNLAKKELIEEVVDEVVNEMANDDISLVNDDVNETEEGITINNFDTASIEDKLAFICEKYNLTDFELKVIISVVFHEAGWYYDDAFKVATVIYNRTKSKENIRYNHYLTKLDGESMYSQVIATGYTKEGRRVQQFDGYLPNEAGYDFDSILKSDTDLLKTNALLDCLILLKLGENYENPTFPLAPCFSNTSFWGDGKRNHFSKPIAAGDVVDNYSFPIEEYDCEFTREDVIHMAKEYVISAKKRVK